MGAPSLALTSLVLSLTLGGGLQRASAVAVQPTGEIWCLCAQDRSHPREWERQTAECASGEIYRLSPLFTSPIRAYAARDGTAYTPMTDGLTLD